MMKADSRGFTLIEVIASMVIMGIVAVVAAMGLVQGVQAYVTTRMNTETLQRAEFALNRLKLEFMVMDSITAANASSITFTSNYSNRGEGVVYIITHSGTGINLSTGGVVNPLLTDLAAGEGAFLTYRNSTGGVWTPGQGFNALHTIAIQLIIPRPDGQENFTFTTAVNPRNNGLANGPEPKLN